VTAFEPRQEESRQRPRAQAISVIRLSGVEIHRAARRHRLTDEDIEHAVTNATTWAELGEDPRRYLVVGPDRSGNLLELMVLHTVEQTELVVRAMALRPSTARELFGREQ